MAESSFQLQQQIKNNAQELGDFLKELNKWEGDIKRKDEELKKTAEIDKIIPPIRRSNKKEQKSSLHKLTKVKSNSEKLSAQKQRISSYDYDAWSKFDVDAACKDVEVEEKDESEDESEEEEEDLEAVLEAEEKRKLQQAEFEKDKGNSLFKDGKYEAAINRYTIAADLNPQSSIILANRAMALIKLERYAAAEVDCTKAIALEPDYAKAVARRATARTKLKKYKEAKEDQERLLELQPNNKQAKVEITKLEKELANVERKNQTRNTSTKQRKPLKRIIIEDIGVGSDEETDESKLPQQNHSDSLQPKPSGKQQQNEREQQQQKNNKPVNCLEENQNKESSSNKLYQTAIIESSLAERSFSVPSSAVQFETEFKKLKKDTNLFYKYFQIIPPQSYKKLFHHCIDEVLPIALECIHSHYVRNNKEYWDELAALTDVPRFEMAVMFLSQNTKRVAADLFQNLFVKDSLKKLDDEAISKLARKYSINLGKS